MIPIDPEVLSQPDTQPQNPLPPPNLVDPVQSEIAKHQLRDEHGKFILA